MKTDKHVLCIHPPTRRSHKPRALTHSSSHGNDHVPTRFSWSSRSGCPALLLAYPGCSVDDPSSAPFVTWDGDDLCAVKMALVMITVVMGGFRENRNLGAKQHRCPAIDQYWHINLHSVPRKLTLAQSQSSFGTTSQEHRQWRNVDPGHSDANVRYILTHI